MPSARITRFLLYITVALLALVLIFYVFLWRAFSPVPESSAYHGDLQRLRALAVGPGLPRALHSIKVGEGAFPDWAIIAGGSPGIDEYPGDWRSFVVEYGDRTVLIDPVHDRELHEVFPFAGAFDDDAFERQQAELKTADLILATHEHWDHVGGVAAAADLPGIQERVRFTEEQLAGSLIAEAKFPPEFLEGLEPLRYDRYHRIAPGLVLMAAAGHTPGSQMIFLKLANGREFLFVGDVIWNEVNLDQLRGHSRFIGVMGGEDLEAKAHQIRWLADLRSTGEVTLIVAHDQKQHAELLRRGLFDEL